ncbi:MAG: Phenylacetate-CoA oxygenase, PaaC subunit [Bacteroidota bacterium]|jgi:ring-1,2-phenylacetyl-CoA epoxidase subunit PaaC
MVPYLLQLADNALILGHRLSEWCGHAPELETDIALANLALDLTGQARSLYQHAAELEGEGRTEDDLAYLRDASAFRHVLLVEQPNQDFAYTIVRQFIFDHFQHLLYTELLRSKDDWLRDFAARVIKEVRYHLPFSTSWLVRLGDGTPLSHQKTEQALTDLWPFSKELFHASPADLEAAHLGIGPDLDWMARLFEDATGPDLISAGLTPPTTDWFPKGGKTGIHSEHLGPLLAEMQFLPRAYPGCSW